MVRGAGWARFTRCRETTGHCSHAHYKRQEAGERTPICGGASRRGRSREDDSQDAAAGFVFCRSGRWTDGTGRNCMRLALGAWCLGLSPATAAGTQNAQQERCSQQLAHSSHLCRLPHQQKPTRASARHGERGFAQACFAADGASGGAVAVVVAVALSLGLWCAQHRPPWPVLPVLPLSTSK
jgi:hypothetical protein